MDTSKPQVRYAFVNSWMLARYTKEQWETHFDYLEQAGINGIITITSAMISEGRMKICFYSSDYPDRDMDNCFPGLLENILEQSERRGFRVFAGLNHSGSEFEKLITDAPTRERVAAEGGIVAGEIYNKYKKKYPNALYGWYLPTELCSKVYMKTPDGCARFCNGYLDMLNEKAPGMPLLLSPYNAWFFGEPEDLRPKLKESFALTHFRAGDVFCPQDCLGTEIVRWDDSAKFFDVMLDAVKTVDGMRLWANCENFKADVPKDELGAVPCRVSRFIRQMQIAAPYVENIATFIYSNYSPDTSHNPYFQDAYVSYLKTGELPVETPNDKYDISVDGKKVRLSFSGSTYGVMKIVIEGQDGKKEYTAQNGGVETELERGEYTAYAIDWERSVSEASVKFNIE